MGYGWETMELLDLVYEQDANGVSHFSAGDVFEAKGVANRDLWYVGCFVAQKHEICTFEPT